MTLSSEINAGNFRQSLSEFLREHRGSLRLVYIPTHRPCLKVLGAVADEIAVAAVRSDDEFQLLVIDDRPENLAEENRAGAREKARSCGFPVNWLTPTAWREFVDGLLAACHLGTEAAERARHALVKPSGSYAAGMNKAALLAAYLGAATLHRRDSDEMPGVDPATGLTALELEIAVLGSQLPLDASEETAVPFCTGSSVRGEPTKDHRDLAAVSPDLAQALESISSRRRHGGEPPAPVSATVTVTSGAEVEVRRDLTASVQVGVSALRRVYEWVPEMPVVNVLGTDHFQKNLLYQMHLPVYWHPLGAYHEYEQARQDQTDDARLAAYVVAELRYAVLRHFWNTANETLRQVARDLLAADGTFRSDLYADAFEDTLDSSSGAVGGVIDRFCGVYEQARQAATGDIAQRLGVRVDALQKARHEVTGYIEEAIREFAHLARIWPRLVTAARAMGGSPDRALTGSPGR